MTPALPARTPGPDPEPSRARAPGGPGTWPHGVSHTPTMSIGAALALLTAEFPAVRISKIRVLEEQGIVTPHRTNSGDRSYSHADIARLRFPRAAQRDSLLPLKAIRIGRARGRTPVTWPR